MASANQNGGRNVPLPEDQEPSWRPEDEPPARFVRRDADDDHDYRAWRDHGSRDDDRRIGPRHDERHGERSTRRVTGSPDERGLREPSSERYGHSLSSYGERYRDERYGETERYGAGRRGGDRPQYPRGSDDRMPSAGSFEDRHHDLGAHDRLTGRGNPTYWQDRTGYELDRTSIRGSYRGRDFEPERHDLSGGSHHDDERLGYAAGSYRRGYAGADAIGADRHTHRGTGPHRGKGPVGYQRSDERIREMLCDALTDDDQLDASRIEVAVNHGEVTLSGTVDDRRAKRDAEDCAYSVSGVRDVHNQLRVAEPSSARSHASGQRAAGKTETETEPAVHDKKHRT